MIPRRYFILTRTLSLTSRRYVWRFFSISRHLHLHEGELCITLSYRYFYWKDLQLGLPSICHKGQLSRNNEDFSLTGNYIFQTIFISSELSSSPVDFKSIFSKSLAGICISSSPRKLLGEISVILFFRNKNNYT